MNILFLARSMDLGGAERQLAILAPGLRRMGHQVKVAVFYGGGPLESALDAGGVPVIHLGKKGRWDIIGFLANLTKTVKKENPEVLHGWLGIPNVLTALLKPLFPKSRIIWAVRSSYMDWKKYDWPPRLAFRLEGWFSGMADLIICNSRAGMEYSKQRGLPESKLLVIANGIDTQSFSPNLEAGENVRREWRVQRKEKLIGLVGRLDPMKDHPTFLKAAALLHREENGLRFVCVGDGPEPYASGLLSLGKSLGLGSGLIWAGERNDMPSVYNALDLLVSSSSGEGFPNTVAEAMASGVPCVVTDVGDAARIVGETGVVVPAGDPAALKDGMVAMLRNLDLDGRLPGERARQRILEEYSMETMISKTVEALRSLGRA